MAQSLADVTRRQRWVAGTVVIVCLVGSAGMAWSQDADAAAKPPKATASEQAATGDQDVRPIAQVDKLTHDFGEVWGGQSLRHEFVIRNAGKEPLKILRVRPSCGCTATEKHPQTIAPGDSGKFPFRLDTSKFRPGKFSKSITVETNDPDHQRLRLILSGTIKHYVDVEPRMAQFGRVKVDSVITRKISLINNTDTPLQLTVSQDKTSEVFKAKLTEVVAGREYELIVTASPPYQTKVNRFVLELTTNLPQKSRIEVICMATLPERLEVQPPLLRVPSPTKAELKRPIRFTNNGDRPVTLLSARSQDGAMDVRINEKEPGKRYYLMVTIPARYQLPPGGTAIILQTDDEKTPELRIPIQDVERPQQPRKPR